LQDGTHFALPFVCGHKNNFMAAGLGVEEKENDLLELLLLLNVVYFVV
jgi:hypothetical protein